MSPSLCRLTSGSQFCLNQRQTSNSSSSSGSNKQQENLPDSQSFGVASNVGCCQRPTPTSTQLKESESGHADTRSRNTSFMISLMEICNKMILPMAALQQDCISCAVAPDVSDLVADTSVSADAAAHPLEDSAGSQLTTPSSSSSSCLRCGNRGGYPLLQVNQQHQQHHQQHKTVGGGGSCKVDRGLESNNANSARYNMYCPAPGTLDKSQSQPPTSSQASPDAAAATAAAAEKAVAEATGEPERKVEAEAERRPLMRSSGVPYWNLAEFQDFRAAPMATPTHLFEPMLDPGFHRHAIILDSHRRLKAAIAGFRAPVYRPY